MKTLAWVVLITALVSGYSSYYVTNNHWTGKWNKRDLAEKSQQVTDLANARKVEQQRQNEKQKIQDDSNVKIADLQKSLDDSNARISRLLSTLKLRKQPMSGSSSSTGSKQASSETGDMQSNMLAESLQRNRSLAEYADRLQISVESCKRQYNSLITKKAP